MEIRKYLILLVTLFVAGCGGASGVRETLGLKQKSPDEFMVLSRPALVVPPDFKLIQPSVQSPVRENKMREQAKEMLFNSGESNEENNQTLGESALLRKAGTNTANKDIKNILREENNENEDKKDGMIESLIKPLNPGEEEPIIDADKEQARIDKNKAEGKTVTEGNVPTKKPGREGILNKILD